MTNIARALIATTAFYFFPFSVGADGAHFCSDISLDKTRLECFDKAFPAPSPEETSILDNWSVKTEKSDFNGKTSIFVSTESIEPVLCNDILEPKRVRLTFRCLEGEGTMILTTECYFNNGSRRMNYVDYNLDGKIDKRHLEISQDGRSMGLTHHTEVEYFIKRLLEKQKIIFRMEPHGMIPADAAFDIGGIEEAIAPLQENCGW